VAPDQRKQMEEMMKSQRETAIKQCNENKVKAKASDLKAYDCMMAAKSMQEITKCGADFGK
jgi:hypothetical protein